MHVEYNYKYDCIVDPYTYSGTAILRNKFNIRDSSVLSKVERRITEAKLVLLQTRQLPRGHYDLKHLQAMHKYLYLRLGGGNQISWLHQQGSVHLLS